MYIVHIQGVHVPTVKGWRVRGWDCEGVISHEEVKGWRE